MKLCAIYNVWDDWDLLSHSIKNIKPYVDDVLIIGSEYSNYGEYSEIPDWVYKHWLIEYSPKDAPMQSETGKRNLGLKIARHEGFTHFLMMDADEFYNPEDLKRGKQMFHENPELQGTVAQTQVFFKSPTLTIGIENTRVPFIHKITPTLNHEFNRKYPFAWEGKDIRIDPTRSLNINSGVEMADITMFHYSWVRPDYEKKIRNSTAKANLERSTIREDLRVAKSGELCKFYNKVLHTVPNYFNIPEYDVMV